MNISVTVGPEREPLTLEEAKVHLRVEHDEDDALIESLITTAREWVEGYLNRALMTQTRKLTISRWPLFPLELPGSPIQSISGITYTDYENNTGTVDEGRYYLMDDGKVTLSYNGEWPTVTLRGPESIYIAYICGFGDDSEDVPKAVRQAMLLLIGSWYGRREGSVDSSMHEIPFGVKELLFPLREVTV